MSNNSIDLVYKDSDSPKKCYEINYVCRLNGRYSSTTNTLDDSDLQLTIMSLWDRGKLPLIDIKVKVI